MGNFQLNFNSQFQDINPVFAGEASPKGGTVQRNARSPYTIIHYIRSGCGTVTTKNHTYPVSAGQIFIFLPGETATYTADENDPWIFRWVGFSGSLATRFSELPPVLQVPEDVFANLCDLQNSDCLLEYQLSSEIYYLQARLLSESQKEADPIQRIMDYIEVSYMKKISVQYLAEQFNLDRSYLYRKFKKSTGLSIQEYIIKIRLSKAIWYLEEGYSIQETATLCGFNNLSNFYQQFKTKLQLHGTPAEWQKKATGAELRRHKHTKEDKY